MNDLGLLAAGSDFLVLEAASRATGRASTAT